MKAQVFTLTEKLWLYPGEQGNWHFLIISKKVGREIKERYGKNARGFGSLPVEVSIGETTWQTSIFPDRQAGTYLLPVKAKVRRAEDIFEGEAVTFSLKVGI